jgi:hypothetical protein
MFILTLSDRTNTDNVNWDRIGDLAYNFIDISVNPEMNSDDEPIPQAWDAGVDIVEDKRYGKVARITGGLGPSGFGSVEIRLPIKDFHRYYRLTVDPQEGCKKELRELLENAGFEVDEVEGSYC